MGMVTVTGRVGDHSRVPIAGRGARLWFRPKRAQTSDGFLLSSGEVQAVLDDTTGSFTVDLDNASTYVPVLDWLVNPAEDAPENRARGYEEWPFEVHPDAGGSISALIDLSVGNQLVYTSPTAPDPGRREAIQINSITGKAYKRKVTY